MVDVLQITSTPDLLAEMIMKCSDLRCVVKRVLLKDLDGKCQKLCSRSKKILQFSGFQNPITMLNIQRLFSIVSKILSCVHLSTG